MQAKTGRQKEFEASLQKLRGKDADISHEAAEIQVLSLISHDNHIILVHIGNVLDHVEDYITGDNISWFAGLYNNS